MKWTRTLLAMLVGSLVVLSSVEASPLMCLQQLLGMGDDVTIQGRVDKVETVTIGVATSRTLSRKKAARIPVGVATRMTSRFKAPEKTV